VIKYSFKVAADRDVCSLSATDYEAAICQLAQKLGVPREVLSVPPAAPSVGTAIEVFFKRRGPEPLPLAVEAQMPLYLYVVRRVAASCGKISHWRRTAEPENKGRKAWLTADALLLNRIELVVAQLPATICHQGSLHQGGGAQFASTVDGVTIDSNCSLRRAIDAVAEAVESRGTFYDRLVCTGRLVLIPPALILRRLGGRDDFRSSRPVLQQGIV
jgi:hypothetical protein